MDHFGGPAVLGGVITGLMLWAWALGRWQGSFPAAPARAAGDESLFLEFNPALDNALDAGSPCQQAARDE